MNGYVRRKPVGRRSFLQGGAAVIGAGLAGAALRGIGSASAQPSIAPQAQVSWQEAMRALIGDAKLIEGKIMLDLPEIAENGNVVPFTFTVDSPMTPDNFVKAVHLFATGNPRPDVASFYFVPENGKASASSRMRLNRTQDVVAVAEMSDGQFYTGKRVIKVTIGGCGG